MGDVSFTVTLNVEPACRLHNDTCMSLLVSRSECVVTHTPEEKVPLSPVSFVQGKSNDERVAVFIVAVSVGARG